MLLRVVGVSKRFGVFRLSRMFPLNWKRAKFTPGRSQWRGKSTLSKVIMGHIQRIPLNRTHGPAGPVPYA